MITRKTIWMGRVAGMAMAGFLFSGCAVLPEAGSPAVPYAPAAKPLDESAFRPVSVSVSEPGVTLTPTKDATGMATENVGRVLRSGDRLLVTIHAPPEPFSAQHVVDEQGQINLPYIGGVLVAGKSCSQAQRDIEKEYIEKKYYKTVTVIIVPPESEYSVSGEVLRPGSYPLTRNQTVMQALARAGRYTEFADQNHVFLIRGNDRLEINVDDIRKGKTKDIVVIPGDVIEVPRTIW